jgi:hypothetical protein
VASFFEWFAEFTAATGESPTWIVFRENTTFGEEDDWPKLPKGLVRISNVSAATLDKQFHDGYGGNGSPNFCAWSDSWVIFSDNYDGAEGPCWVPRNPTAHDPIRPGGG